MNTAHLHSSYRPSPVPRHRYRVLPRAVWRRIALLYAAQLRSAKSSRVIFVLPSLIYAWLVKYLELRAQLLKLKLKSVSGVPKGVSDNRS